MPKEKEALKVIEENNNNNNNPNVNNPQSKSKTGFKTKIGSDEIDYNELPYLDAIDIDKRSFFVLSKEFLISNQIIISTFTEKNDLISIPLRLSMLFFSLESFFFFNSLLYTDDYVEKHYKKKMTFIDILTDQIKITLIVDILVVFLQKLFGLVLSFQEHFDRVIRATSKFEKEKYAIFFRNKCKTQLRFYFILVVFCSLIFWYYMANFCCAYPNSQTTWITSSLISIALNIFTVAAISFLVGSLRAIGIKYRNK